MSNEIVSKARPATDFKTTDRDGSVKLRFGTEGISANEPLTLPYLLKRTATNYPDVAALKRKNVDNVWETVTYSQYRENVLKAAKIFIKLGLEPRHTVAILAFNSPEWFYSELGAIHAGYVKCTKMYKTFPCRLYIR